MVQGMPPSVRIVMAGLLMLAALVLFGAPSAAYAHGSHEHAASAPAAAPSAGTAVDIQARVLRVATGFSAAPQAGLESVQVVSAMPVGDDGCGRQGGRGCCVGTTCPMIHSAIAPIGMLPMPTPMALALSIPSGLLSDGVGTRPGLRPPRRFV